VPQKKLTNRSRPRCLIWGFDYKVQATIARMFAEVEVISSLEEVHQEDWDLLVAQGQDVSRADPHLFVVAYAGMLIDGPEGKDGILLARGITYPDKAHEREFVCQARDFTAPTDAPAGFDLLVSSDLLPLVKKEGQHSALISYSVKNEEVKQEPSLAVPQVKPLLIGSDGAVIAAVFDRGKGAKCLTLPQSASLDWISAAINEWHKDAPKVFPHTLDWTSDAYAWLTPEEITAVEAALQADKVKEEAETTSKEAWQSFQAARDVAAVGMWRLLTASGTPLEEAVSAALREIGFAVRDMDAEWPEGQRFEDLRVTEAAHEGWEAIVEIKGYSRSRGKSEDITNLYGRFLKNYRRTEKREPSALWYVVNHDQTTHPEQREALFSTAESEMATFAENDGLAIDTVDLYRLWRDVRRNKIEAEEARSQLIEGRGRFSHDWAKEKPPR
jgi:hypothetical protein